LTASGAPKRDERQAFGHLSGTEGGEQSAVPAENPRNSEEPTPGLEPGTPSLRVSRNVQTCRTLPKVSAAYSQNTRVEGARTSAGFAPSGCPGLAPGKNMAAMTEWDKEALPVLRAVYDVAKTKTADWPYVSQRDVNEALGREENDPITERTIRDLGRTDYLAGVGRNVDQIAGPIDFELTEKSLQQLAGWPSRKKTADAFLEALAARINSAPAEERGRLERLQASASEVGHGVLADLIAGTIRGAGLGH
jgi:hypothetical protein